MAEAHATQHMLVFRMGVTKTKTYEKEDLRLEKEDLRLGLSFLTTKTKTL